MFITDEERDVPSRCLELNTELFCVHWKDKVVKIVINDSDGKTEVLPDFQHLAIIVL